MSESLFDLHRKNFSTQMTEKGVWIEDELFSVSTLHELLALAKEFEGNGSFRLAQIGKDEKKQLAPDVRKDQIFWINDWSVEPLLRVQEMLVALQKVARRELFLPLKRFEAHFSCYKNGDFYKPHVDRHQKAPGRVLSLVLYLNDLSESDGGELVIHHCEGEGTGLTVRPKQGRVVVFDSRVLHEVKTVHTSRFSLTCWFRDDEAIGI